MYDFVKGYRAKRMRKSPPKTCMSACQKMIYDRWQHNNLRLATENGTGVLLKPAGHSIWEHVLSTASRLHTAKGYAYESHRKAHKINHNSRALLESAIMVSFAIACSARPLVIVAKGKGGSSAKG